MEIDLHGYQVLFLFLLAFSLVAVCFYAWGGGYKRRRLFFGSVVVLTVFIWPPLQLELSVHHLNQSKEVAFCASCHEMDLHVKDVTHRKSRSLASKHMRRSWINDHPCYTCHTNYTLFGPVEAKLKGLVHMGAALFQEVEEADIELYQQPYPDVNCLQCHDNERFDKEEDHEDIDPDERCVDCHDNIHKIKKAKKLDEETGEEKEDAEEEKAGETPEEGGEE